MLTIVTRDYSPYYTETAGEPDMRNLIMAGMLAGLALVTTSAQAQEQEQEQALKEATPPAMVDYKAILEKKVRMNMRDPTSVLYEWGNEPRIGWADMAFSPRYEGLVGCFMFKGKNGYGGYADWVTSIYVIDPASGSVLTMFGTVDGKPPKIGKFISHDPGCPQR